MVLPEIVSQTVSQTAANHAELRLPPPSTYTSQTNRHTCRLLSHSHSASQPLLLLLAHTYSPAFCIFAAGWFSGAVDACKGSLVIVDSAFTSKAGHLAGSHIAFAEIKVVGCAVGMPVALGLCASGPARKRW